MFAQIFFFIFVLFQFFIWLPGASDYTVSMKIFLTGMTCGGLVVALWLDTIKTLGFKSLRTAPLMARIFGMSKRGSTLLALVIFCLIFWWSPYTKNPSPFRIEMSLAAVLTSFLLWLQPPAVLMLGESNSTSGRVLKKVSTSRRSLRNVALLDITKTGKRLGTFSLLTDDIRTESYRDWRTVVDLLVEVVPAIVLDARTDSKLVADEVKLIIERPNRLRRTIFVVHKDGAAPALAKHNISSKTPGVFAIQEEEIQSTLRGWTPQRTITEGED